MTDARRAYVAVVGSGTAAPAHERGAEEIGRALARAGAVLVCGGLGGVMEAACRGAAGEGGVCVGLLPGDDRAAGNEHLTVAIATGLGEARNALVVRAADVLVAVGGEWGTLSEIALALKTGVPVVALDTWEVARRGEPVPGIERVGSAGEAAERALALVPGRARRQA